MHQSFNKGVCIVTSLTRKQLIADRNYVKQALVRSIFFVAALGVTLLELLSIKEWDLNAYIAIAVVVVCVVIPFGYFAGFRGIWQALRKMSKIRNGKFTVYLREVIEIDAVNGNYGMRNYHVICGEEENAGVWLAQRAAKEFSVGDTCYWIVLEGEKDNAGLYATKNTVLDDDIRSCLVMN